MKRQLLAITTSALAFCSIFTSKVLAYAELCNPFDAESGVNTVFGCVKTVGGDASKNILTFIIQVATGLGGGIALLLILYGVFIVTTSAGIPDKLKAGNEIITSAVIGLIFILLSVFLVNLIGINILGIPGLT